MSEVYGTAVVEAEISFDQIRRELEPGMRAALAQIAKDTSAAFTQMERDGKTFGQNVGRAGQQGGKELAKGVESGADQAGRSLQGTGKAAGAAGEQISRAGRAAGSGFGGGVEDGARRAERAAQESSKRIASQAAASGRAAGEAQGSGMASGVMGSLSGVTGQMGAVGARGATLLGSSFTKTIGALGIATTIGSILTAGFNRLEAIDTAKFKLKALGNDATKVDEIMKNASAAVTGTAFSMGDAATVAATATSAGIKAGGELERYLKIVAGTAAVTGAGLGEMGSIMNKVQVSGKAMTDDLQQIGDRGFDIWGALRDQTGKTIPELQKMATEGKITSDVLQSALEKKVGNAAKVMGGSVRASIDNVKASIGRLGASMLEPVFKVLPSILDGMMKGFDSLGKGVKAALASEPVQSFLGQVGRIRDAISGTVQLFTTGNFTGGIGKLLGVEEEDEGIVTKILGIRDAIGNAVQTILPTLRSIGENLLGNLRNIGQIAMNVGSILVSAFKSDIFQTILQGALGLAGVIGGALLIAWDLLSAGIEKVTGAIAKVTGFFRDHQGILSTIAVTITAAFLPALISTGVQYAIGTARAVAWVAILGAQKIAAAAAAIAQRALNLAMSANPIGLIIAGITALVAGLVWFFTKTETGRKVWSAAWNGIKEAMSAVVNWVTGTAVPWLGRAWDSIKEAVGSAINWVREHWRLIISIVGGPLGLLVAVVTKYWDQIKGAIRAAVDWVTGTAIPFLKSAWDNIQKGLEWLYNNVIQPIWNGIKFAISLAVAFIRAEIEGFKKIWAAIEPVLMWLWQNVVQPVWDGISSAIRTVVEWIKDKAVPWVQEAWRNFTVGLDYIIAVAKEVWKEVKDKFNNLVDFVKGLPDKIRSAAQGMWDGIKDAFKSVINWVVDKWNSLSFRLPRIEVFGKTITEGTTFNVPQIPKLAGGGIIRGPGTGTSDSILGRDRASGLPTAWVSNRESVNTAESTDRNWPLFSRLNAGQSLGQALAAMLPGFADGGLVNTKDLSAFASGVEGKPYVWGGVNWGDCSGAVSALVNKAVGRAPFGSRFATGTEGSELAARGFKPGLGPAGSLNVGWFNGGPYGGHTAATLPDGTNFEMGGKRGNGQFGGPAAGARDSQFTDHAHLPPEHFTGLDAGAPTTGGGSLEVSAGAGSGGSSSSSDSGSGSSSAGSSSSSGSSISSSGSSSGGGGGDRQLTLEEEIQRLPLTMLEGALGIKLPWLDPTKKTASTAAVTSNAKEIAQTTKEITKTTAAAKKDAADVTRAQNALADKKAAVAVAEQKLAETNADPKAKDSAKLAAEQAVTKAKREQAEAEAKATETQKAASSADQVQENVKAVGANTKALAEASKTQTAKAKADNAVADKQDALKLAEQKLAEVKADPKAKDSARLSAEQGVTKAQRNLTLAQDQARQASEQARTAAAATQQAATTNQRTAAVSAGTAQQVAASAGAAAAGPPAPALGKLTGSSSKDEIAQAILTEARNRGYSEDAQVAALATGLQESGLNPGAQGGGGAWHGIYQQDSSYAGRDDPNKNIGAFFDRLDPKMKGAGASGDPWKNIFWLQQAPGRTSADAAYSGGRQGYLAEIQSKRAEAEAYAARFRGPATAPAAGPATPDVTALAPASMPGGPLGAPTPATTGPTIPGSADTPGQPAGAPQKDTSQVDAGVGQGATGGGGDIFTQGLSWGGDAIKEIGGEFLGMFGLDGILGRGVDMGVNAGKAGIEVGKKAAQAGISAAAAGGSAVPGPGGVAAGVAGQAAQAAAAPLANTVIFQGQTVDQVQSGVQRGLNRDMAPVRETLRGNG